jgi:hypothetical protein
VDQKELRVSFDFFSFLKKKKQEEERTTNSQTAGVHYLGQ